MSIWPEIKAGYPRLKTAPGPNVIDTDTLCV